VQLSFGSRRSPDDHAKRAKAVAERRIVLAGYRLADLLKKESGRNLAWLLPVNALPPESGRQPVRYRVLPQTGHFCWNA
jgi:hypothetical protein